MHEQQLRFFVYCAHALPSSEPDDRIRSKIDADLGFVPKNNDEAIDRSITTLFEKYEDNRARGRWFESEPEFASYALLMKLGSGMKALFTNVLSVRAKQGFSLLVFCMLWFAVFLNFDSVFYSEKIISLSILLFDIFFMIIIAASFN